MNSTEILTQAQEAYFTDDYHQAIELYEQAIEKYSFLDWQSYYRLAKSYKRIGEYELALKYMRIVLNAFQNSEKYTSNEFIKEEIATLSIMLKEIKNNQLPNILDIYPYHFLDISQAIKLLRQNDNLDQILDQYGLNDYEACLLLIYLADYYIKSHDIYRAMNYFHILNEDKYGDTMQTKSLNELSKILGKEIKDYIY